MVFENRKKAKVLNRNRIQMGKGNKLERLTEVVLKAGATKINLSGIKDKVNRDPVSNREEDEPEVLEQQEVLLLDLVPSEPCRLDQKKLEACANQDLGCPIRFKKDAVVSSSFSSRHAPFCRFQPAKRCPGREDGNCCRVARQLLCVHLIIEHEATHISGLGPNAQFTWQLLSPLPEKEALPAVFNFGSEFLFHFAVKDGNTWTWVSADLRSVEQESSPPKYVGIKVVRPGQEKVCLSVTCPLQHLEASPGEVAEAKAGLMLTPAMLAHFQDKATITFDYCVDP